MEQIDKLTEIIADCQAGREEAFSQLVDIFAKPCFGYFLRLTGNREISNDLLGELFVKLVEKIGSFRAGSFEKWIFTIARNIFYDFLRRKQREKKMLRAEEEKFAEEVAVDSSIEKEQIDKLQEQLGKLEAQTRELILLRFYSGLSFKEIAEAEKMPIGTVLAKVHRGLKKLRQLMEH